MVIDNRKKRANKPVGAGDGATGAAVTADGDAAHSDGAATMVSCSLCICHSCVYFGILC